MLALVTAAGALSRDGLREPMVKFIDFYIAAERADAPKLHIWERIIYWLAISRTPGKAPVPRCGDEC